MRMAGASLAAGYKAIDIRWNNEAVELTFSDNAGLWYGVGAINHDSAQTIARELNEIRQFVLDHFQIIRIGHARA
jgi:predicted secreted protein